MHPLDLVEIRLHLAPFLSRHTLTICARVSKDWRASFEPFIWQDVQVQINAASIATSSPPSSPIATTPPIELLIQNARWIRHLLCETQTMGLVLKDQLTCPSLKSLNLLARARANAADKDPTVTLPEQAMIERHRETLQNLSLNFIAWSGSKIWEILGSCSKLESLVVENALIREAPDWLACWKVWSQLWSLELDSHFLEEDGPEPPTWSTMEGCDLSRIRELKLGLCPGLNAMNVIQILRHCPELTTLDWKVPVRPIGSASPMKLLAKNLQGNNPGSGSQITEPFCPNLVSLTMSERGYIEQDLVEFLEARSRVGLKDLSLQRGVFGVASWNKILQGFAPQHLAALRTLNLRGSTAQVDGKMVQEMLCSLPGLRVFSATTLSDSDLKEDPRPWVCLGLTHLALDFELSHLWVPIRPSASSSILSATEAKVHYSSIATAARMDQRRMIMTQLALLTKLQVLVTNEVQDVRRSRDTLDFSIASGLELLQGWKHLRKLSVVKAELALGEEEIRWMLQNWPSLEIFEGTLNPDVRTWTELTTLLDDANIEHRLNRNPSDGWLPAS